MEKRIGCFMVAASFLVILCLGGCGRHIRAGESVFAESGIPARQFLVGGGFEIKWVAPSNGTAYWVEETTQKILETRSVKEGEAVEFGGGSPEPEAIKAALGIEMADARFTFYFVPSKRD